MIEEEIFRRAMDVFGVKAELQKAQEECAELVVAISRYNRQPSEDTLQALINEVADVKIMMGQLEFMLGSEAVGAMVTVKMDRLRAEIVTAQSEVYGKPPTSRLRAEETTP